MEMWKRSERYYMDKNNRMKYQMQEKTKWWSYSILHFSKNVLSLKKEEPFLSWHLVYTEF